MVDQRDVQKLEEQIMRVSQSTKTIIPAFTPIHDWLRRTFPWYYNWSAQRSSVGVHVIILILIIIAIAYFFLRATANAPL